MLSMAIANELSRSNKVLLLDLDFFNRGLTGLLSSIRSNLTRIKVDFPDFLDKSGIDKPSWYVAEIKAGLYTAFYGDIDRSASARIELMDVNRLGEAICAFVMKISEITDCNVVVFDCHGGPDNTSFAACINADHTIIVSEPDRVTFYGTLNFLRRLQEINLERSTQPHLVFNKVIPGFSARFLIRSYDDYLKENLNGNPLLAVYPLEVDLTKEFEKTPFLTSVFPTSQLAEKTRFLLYDLLFVKHRALLPPGIANFGYITRTFHRYYMGRLPKIFNLDLVMRAIAAAGIGTAVSAFLNEFYERVSFTNFFITALVALTAWLLVSAVINWARALDVFLTYGFRTGIRWKAIIGCTTLIALISATFIVLTFVMEEAGGSVLGYASLLSAPVIWHYARRGLQNIRLDRRYVEGGFRVTVSVAVVGALISMAMFRAF